MIKICIFCHEQLSGPSFLQCLIVQFVLAIRDGPFNIQGGGGLGFFFF